MSGLGLDQFGPGMSDMLEKMMPAKQRRRKMTVAQALRHHEDTAVEALLDQDAIIGESIRRAEEDGIIFIDEIDKIAMGEGKGSGPDVSRQGVQRDLLPIVEGSVINTRHGPVKTDHVLFIAAGAFHVAKVSDLMPELQGRFPIRVELSDLTKDDFVRILTEPENSDETDRRLLSTEQVERTCSPRKPSKPLPRSPGVNRQEPEHRRPPAQFHRRKSLRRTLLHHHPNTGEKHAITGRMVKGRLTKITNEDDRSKYLL